MNFNSWVLLGLVGHVLLSFVLDVTALGGFFRVLGILAVFGWILYCWYEPILEWIRARLFLDLDPVTEEVEGDSKK